jgi:AraC-like DNA-binding protein
MPTPLIEIKNWAELAQQAKWSASALARQCGVAERTLRRHFLKFLGTPPKTWLEEHRLQTALKLLCGGSSAKETAAHLGYKQQSSLTRICKKKTGIGPSKQPRKTRNP